MSFDPNAAAKPGAGIFGLPPSRERSRIWITPVPFDATTSYRPGTRLGPAAVLDASMQVDLEDRTFPRPYEQGIFMHDEPAGVRELSEKARLAAEPVIEAGGAEPDSPEHAAALDTVNQASHAMNLMVRERTLEALQAGRVPALLGGEHSTPFGAIQAVAEQRPGVGILHVDAHMDLRDAYEGFTWSHASIMHNVLRRVPGVSRLVQVGIRDYSQGELETAEQHAERVRVFFDEDLSVAMLNGARWDDLCAKILEPLPPEVYVSFDIDGLDPSMCPHTGTPVPGGLSFHQAVRLLKRLRDSGRTVVGFDLVEVAPGPAEDPDWDANVGARLLYKLCGCAAPR